MTPYDLWFTTGSSGRWTFIGTQDGRNTDHAVSRYFARSGNHVPGNRLMVTGCAYSGDSDTDGSTMDHKVAVEYMILAKPAAGTYPYWLPYMAPSFDYFFLRRLEQWVYPAYGTFREIRAELS